MSRILLPFLVVCTLILSSLLPANAQHINRSSDAMVVTYFGPFENEKTSEADSIKEHTPVAEALKEQTPVADTIIEPAPIVPLDSARYFNMYGNLRNDMPEYNIKSSPWFCGLRVVVTNIVTWSFDRYAFNADYARIGIDSWRQNLSTAPGWDVDRFGMNYFAHPYSGMGYFNAARANGYNFIESLPFTLGGSIMWEYLGENTEPSLNDLVNTTVTGAFLGEIAYRLSSNFLDDRTTGFNRAMREIFAGLIDPSRFFSRLLRGQMFRVTTEEIYQKEPLNLTFGAGARLINDGREFGTGEITQVLSLILDYGNPFEYRTRKIFDYFKLRADLTFGTGRKIIGNILGQAILFGSNTRTDNTDMLLGVFQHYDFWDNQTFELGTIGFGGGVISKLRVGETDNFYYDAHLAVVPLAGNSRRLGPDTTQIIDYNYGGGMETKVEGTLNLGSWVSLTFRGYYYWIHTYVGIPGDNLVGIIKPSVVLNIIGGLGIGFEQQVYYTDRYTRDYGDFHDVRTEQRVFVQLYVDNFKQQR